MYIHYRLFFLQISLLILINCSFFTIYVGHYVVFKDIAIPAKSLNYNQSSYNPDELLSCGIDVYDVLCQRLFANTIQSCTLGKSEVLSKNVYWSPTEGLLIGLQDALVQDVVRDLKICGFVNIDIFSIQDNTSFYLNSLVISLIFVFGIFFLVRL